MKINQIKVGALTSYLNIFLINIANLAITPFMLKSLGKSEYGLYILIGSFAGYLAVLDFGLGNTIIRYVAKYREEKDKKGEENFIALSILMYSVIAAFLVLIGIILYFNLDGIFKEAMTANEMSKAKIMFVLIVINMAVSLPLGAFAAVMNGYERFVVQRLILTSRLVFRTIILAVILAVGLKAVSIVILDTIMNLLVVSINAYYVLKRLKVKIRIHFIDRSFIFEIFSFSFFVFLNMIVDQLYWRIGQFVLGIALGTAAVAVYAIGIQFTQFYLQVSTAISSVFLPRVTQMVTRKESNSEINDFFIKTGRIQLIVLAYILLAFTFFGRDFVILWAGPEYGYSWTVALLMMIPLTVPLFQNIGIQILQAKNMHAFRSVIYLCIAAINVALSMLLVNILGILGVVLGTILSLVLGNIIVINLYYHYKIGLNMMAFIRGLSSRLIPAIFISAVICLCTLLIPGKSWLLLSAKGLIYTIIYFAAMWIYGMNSYEKSLISGPISIILNKLPFQRMPVCEKTESILGEEMMSIKQSKNSCNACGACLNVCPVGCVEMIEDKEGFRYAETDNAVCIDCGLCYEICQGTSKVFDRMERFDNPFVYAAWNNNEVIRKRSSSGGVFTAFSNVILKKKGMVSGAEFDNEFLLNHVLVGDEVSLDALRGSKYIQSNTGLIFKEIKRLLESDINVLFSGTPCQVAGLYSYLGGDMKGLVTCDVVCHGVASAKVFYKILDDLEKSQQSKVDKVNFREKTYGWKEFSFSMKLKNGLCQSKSLSKDEFMQGYIQNLFLRPSCHNCAHTGVPRRGDITLGDFWGINSIYPDIDDDRGISLLILNSDKGLELFKDTCNQLETIKCRLDDAVAGNPCIIRPVQPSKSREAFFKDLELMPAEQAIRRHLKRSGARTVLRKVKDKLLSKELGTKSYMRGESI